VSLIVTARGAGLGAWIDEDFAHCKQIVLVESGDTFDAWENSFGNDSSGVALARRILSSTVHLEGLLTRGIGLDALAVFRAHDVPVYLAEMGSVLELVEMARNGKLDRVATAR
jgi:predicted Fe-Mo cluster-binding NifX family protein